MYDFEFCLIHIFCVTMLALSKSDKTIKDQYLITRLQQFIIQNIPISLGLLGYSQSNIVLHSPTETYHE